MVNQTAQDRIFVGGVYLLLYTLLLAIALQALLAGGLLLSVLLTLGLLVLACDRSLTAHLWIVAITPNLLFLIMYLIMPGYICPFVSYQPLMFFVAMAWPLAGLLALRLSKTWLSKLLVLLVFVVPVVLVLLFWATIWPIPGKY